MNIRRGGIVKKPEKQTIHCGKSHNLIDPRDCLYFYDADEIDTYLSSIADVERIKRTIRPLDIMHETKRNGCFESDLYQIATAISSYIKGNK